MAGLNKEALTALAVSVFSSCSSLVFTTMSVNGNKDFSAWEWVSLASPTFVTCSPGESTSGIYCQ